MRFVVLSLGGNDGIRKDCATQLSELKRLGVPMSAIIDSDKDFEAAELQEKHRGFAVECERFGIRCHITARRATENYFDQASIQAAMPDFPYNALAPFEKAPKGWPKRDNWKIARAMTKDALEATDIGQFLMEIARDPLPVKSEDKPATS